MSRTPRIPLKQVLVSGAIALGLIALSVLFLVDYRQTMMKEREDRVRTMVENVYDLVDFYYVKIAKEGMAESDAKEFAIQAIRDLPYDVNGYTWINDMQGVMVMHPSMPELNGRNLLEYKDSNGKYLFKEFIATVRNKQAGFVGYMWPKPGATEGQAYPKLSYVKGFAPWQWIIGSGIYIDDVDEAFRHAIFVSGGLVLMALLFAVALAVTLSESLKKP